MRGFLFKRKWQPRVRRISAGRRRWRAVDARAVLFGHCLSFAGGCPGRCRAMCPLADRCSRPKTGTEDAYRFGLARKKPGFDPGFFVVNGRGPYSVSAEALQGAADQAANDSCAWII